MVNFKPGKCQKLQTENGPYRILKDKITITNFFEPGVIFREISHIELNWVWLLLTS